MSQQGVFIEKTGKSGDGSDAINRYVAQVFIFQGEDYLGWDCFYKDKISIGRSKNADVVLSDDGLSDIQANVYFKGDQIIVSDQTDGHGVFVNNRPFKTIILGPLDYVDIGPYTIKVKLRKNGNRYSEKEGSIPDHSGKNSFEEEVIPKSRIAWPSEKNDEDQTINKPDISNQIDEKDGNQAEPFEMSESDRSHQKETENGENNIENNKTQKSGDCTDNSQNIEEGRYRLVSEGQIRESLSLEEVKKKLTGIFKTGKKGIEGLFSGKQVTIKKDTDYETAVKLQNTLEKAGVITKVEAQAETDGTEHGDAAAASDIHDKADTFKDDSVDDRNEQTINSDTTPAFSIVNHEDEDEEEEDFENLNNLYFLKNRLINVKTVLQASNKNPSQIIEVLKYRKNILIDVAYLGENEKYHIGSGKSKFLLAEHDRKNTLYFYFSDKLTGMIRKNEDEHTETHHLQLPEKLYNKKKKIYRDMLPQDGEAIISDGTYEYLLRHTVKQESAEAIALPKKQRTFHKFLAKSVLIHLILLIIFSLYMLIPNSETLLPETHFVKIETKELLKLEKKPVLPPKVKPEPEPQPKEKPIVANAKPKQETPEEKSKTKPRHVASAKPSKIKSKSQTKVSRHPDAGGGYGKGNVSNRNVNQTGLLSLIGDSVSLKPTSAMAAVTNLDAVSSRRGSEGDFKVNGIVGKLGSAKIEVPKSGGIVSTKGSTQVLRSAGAGGKGRVAALEKGKTGQKQVMGMVSAKLTRTVNIRGGMSREAVKQVIDQHLDEVSYCYESALLSNPSIMGKVIFEWKILLSGRVGEVKIKSSTINSSEIHSCIKSAIKTWQFPKPKGNEVIVSYPFIFDIVGF